MKVVCDDTKNRANLRKHGVTFEEAGRLFTSAADDLEIFDAAHSEEEDRFIAIGSITRVASSLSSGPNVTKRKYESLALVGQQLASESCLLSISGERNERYSGAYI